MNIPRLPALFPNDCNRDRGQPVRYRDEIARRREQERQDEALARRLQLLDAAAEADVDVLDFQILDVDETVTRWVEAWDPFRLFDFERSRQGLRALAASAVSADSQSGRQGQRQRLPVHQGGSGQRA